MTIHSEHPFLDPESTRRPVRRLRGRLTAPVTLWTAAANGRRAGLPVSSLLVADGDPGEVAGLVDPESDLWPLLTEAGRFAVHVLDWPHRQLAEAFAGTAPAPGGPFRLAEWSDTRWGPVLVGASAWAGCVWRADLPMGQLGYADLVRGAIEQIELAGDAAPLLHRRGRFRTLPD